MILEFVINISELYSIIVIWGGLIIININLSCLGFFDKKDKLNLDCLNNFVINIWIFDMCYCNCYCCLFDLKQDDTGCSFTCHNSWYLLLLEDLSEL